MKKYIYLVFAFAESAFLSKLGYPITTYEYWIMLAIFIGYGIAFHEAVNS